MVVCILQHIFSNYHYASVADIVWDTFEVDKVLWVLFWNRRLRAIPTRGTIIITTAVVETIINIQLFRLAAVTTEVWNIDDQVWLEHGFATEHLGLVRLLRLWIGVEGEVFGAH